MEATTVGTSTVGTITHQRIGMKNFILAMGVGMMLVCGSVFALDLQTAKEQGLVGETDTGYLGAVKSSPEVAALIVDINAQRKAEYQRIAKQNGIAVSDVEKLAAKKAITKTPAGGHVNIGGDWRIK